MADAPELLEQWRWRGGKAVLHTGYHDCGQQQQRGISTCIAVLAGIHTNCFRPFHKNYRPELVEQLEEMVPEGQALYGGLHEPQVTTPAGALWVTELGPGESGYLTSVLGSACYVLVAALTGMRNTELQQLERGCISHSSGIPSITSPMTRRNPHHCP